jgi:hypothetical protein
MWKIILKLKKNTNFKILTQVCMRFGELEVRTGDMQQDAVVQ